MTEAAEAPSWADEVFEGTPESLPEDRAVSIRIGMLDFACKLTRGAPGDRLMVHLLGTIAAGAAPPNLKEQVFPPGFHVLTISDPSLLLDPILRRGVFLGPRLQDPQDGVAEIVTAVARQLDLQVEETLFYGASGSGVAGCMAACRIGARCVAVNAQLDLYQARRMPHARIMQRIFDPTYHFAKIDRTYPHRLRVKMAYRRALNEGRLPRLMVYQNTVDVLHHKGFYLPFCEAMKLNPEQDMSEDGGLRVEQIQYPGGHKVHAQRAVGLIQRSLEFLYPMDADAAREAA